MSKVVTFAGSKFIPLEALNVGYSASTTSQPTDQDEPVGPAQAGGVSGFQPVAEGENSNDAFSVGPETPQRAPEPNPGNCHTIKSCTYMSGFHTGGGGGNLGNPPQRPVSPPPPPKILATILINTCRYNKNVVYNSQIKHKPCFQETSRIQLPNRAQAMQGMTT